MLYITTASMPSPFSNRVFATWFSWHREETSGDFVIAFAPLEEYDGDVKAREGVQAMLSADKAAAKVVRGTSRGFMRISAVAPNACKLTFAGQGDLAGNIPSWVVNHWVLYTLGLVKRVQDKFQRNGKKVSSAALSLPTFHTFVLHSFVSFLFSFVMGRKRLRERLEP